MPFATSSLLAALTTLAAPALSLGLQSGDKGGPLICRPFIDFSDPAEAERWRVVNDGVMGGRSSGQMRFEDGRMRYTGAINTNGGGFSSIRRPLVQGELGKAVALKINYSGDDREYKLSLRSSAAFRGRRISFQAPIPSRPNGAIVALDELEGSFRGYAIPNARFERDEAVELGLILADGRDGPFDIALRSIEICEVAI